VSDKKIVLLKVIIVLLSAFLLFKSIHVEKSGNIKEVWTDCFTLFKSQSVQLFINPIKPHKASKLVIYDVNNLPVDSITVNLRNNPIIKQNEWLTEKSYSTKINYTPTLPSGLYHLENLSSFCVMDTTAEWIIVLSNTSYLAASGMENFFSPIKNTQQINDSLYNSETKIPYYLSTLQPTLKIANLQTITNIIKEVFPAANITYCSDMDLYIKYIPKKNQNLVFVGNFAFMNSLLANGIKQHQLNGGKILMASSNFMNNRIRTDLKNNYLIFYNSSTKDPVKDSSKSAIQFNDLTSNQPNYKIVGGNYQNADKASQNYFTLTHVGKKILLTITDTLFFNSTYYNGICLTNNFNIDLQKTQCDSGEIFATIPCKYHANKGFGTIGVLHKKTGTLLFLPTEQWFDKENQDKEWVKKLTLVLLKKYF